MAGGYAGTPAEFADAHQKVNNTKQEMDSQLAKLRGEIESTQGAWQGKAATVFTNVMETFDQKSTALNNSLEEIGELLRKSGVAYDTQEQDTNQSLSSLSAALDGL